MALSGKRSLASCARGKVGAPRSARALRQSHQLGVRGARLHAAPRDGLEAVEAVVVEVAPETPGAETVVYAEATDFGQDDGPSDVASVPEVAEAAAEVLVQRLEAKARDQEAQDVAVVFNFGGDAPSSMASAGSVGASAASVASPRRAPRVDLPLDALMRRRGPGAAPRPFPPPLDLPRITDALFGDPAIGPIFQQLFDLSMQNAAYDSERSAAQAAAASSVAGGAESDGAASGMSLDGGAGAEAGGQGPGPLLYAPVFERPAGSAPADTLPLLVYLPGIDGTGLAAYRQFPRLSSKFDLRNVFLPPSDRTPFAGLVDSLARQIEAEASLAAPSRPVYLMGESFGGLLALALAQRLSCVDRVVLVNPATSFDRSPWPALGPLLPQLPPDLYRLLPVALSPVLANPLSMARGSTDPSDPLPTQAVDLLYGLLDLIPELSSLRVVLPPETLSWRLALLREGAQAVNPTLAKVRQRTLLLAGQLDLVIPSAQEAPRLAKAMPRCQPRVIPGGSHALLQESEVDVLKLMQEEDFYVSTRRFTRPPKVRRGKPAAGGAVFGSPGPLELPTSGELQRACDNGGLTGLRRLVSPVFVTTDAATGRRQLGLGGLPAVGSGPMLFVGNHQLLAPDMPLMIEQFIKERGQLLRGLAHPMALGQGGGAVMGGAESESQFGRFLETFGAVPVSGKNLYSLLQGGEAALLYPGGVREALKLKGERYALIWPRRPEFVRMACRFGATIIPFAAIGAEDSVDILLDRQELLRAPLLGPALRRQQDKMITARRGVSESAEVEESFISPLIGLRPPARFYYSFAAPIATTPDLGEDRAAVDELYGRVRGEVEGCLGYLLQKRETDPFKDLAPRLLYEAAWGGRRQAPTFKP
ncbi:hypothetical protein HYH03_003198 [Edaphochlamys debaryana]|uniref:AB hydrolase-1 domain-containing protein n=1 Tax=Edaphochlamys debaryana TaxID=47281 RepID=A0A835YCG0_9CHLO|nr:hypothetical protein HYH03_003198 [Edaphochlamys debaryana]|eukprot:KAG2499012.1 hypothetical protein HYH03_003198 [Edaphochlamys debaryana]